MLVCHPLSSRIEDDCKVEATLHLISSLVVSGKSLWHASTASSIDTIVSVGIRLGVMECFSP